MPALFFADADNLLRHVFASDIYRGLVVRLLRFYVKEVVYAVRYLSARLCGDESYRVSLEDKPQFSGCIVFGRWVAVYAAVLLFRSRR